MNNAHNYSYFNSYVYVDIVTELWNAYKLIHKTINIRIYETGCKNMSSFDLVELYHLFIAFQSK